MLTVSDLEIVREEQNIKRLHFSSVLPLLSAAVSCIHSSNKTGNQATNINNNNKLLIIINKVQLDGS